MKIALNTYSLRNEWDRIEKHGMAPVVAFCKDAGIDTIEWLDRHLNKATLAADTKALADQGITVFAIGPHVHLLAKPKEVDSMVAQGKEWLAAAAGAGIPFVRFQIGDGPLPRAFAPLPDFEEDEWAEYNEQIEEAIEASAPVVDPLVEAAEQLGATIAIETHHSYSSNFVYMKLFNQRWMSKRAGWIFDIGNYENDYMRWEALEVIKGRTCYLHAKAYDFDATGLETTIDFPKAAKILHAAGFTGNWSIEFEGKMNGFLGTLRTNELCKHAIAAATGGSYTMKTSFPSGDDLVKQYAP